ncbi:unnamed protein product [Rangifer tarandus platyrhynchus]|uniref:Uncharacterized protein n=1 Tax=Rangifer tarandus platyrhynchus TaxID=3082113 RepID=A0AC59YGH4_RANTA
MVVAAVAEAAGTREGAGPERGKEAGPERGNGAETVGTKCARARNPSAKRAEQIGPLAGAQKEDEQACVADKGEFADFARRSSRPEEKGEFALAGFAVGSPVLQIPRKTLVNFPWLLSLPK